MAVEGHFKLERIDDNTNFGVFISYDGFDVTESQYRVKTFDQVVERYFQWRRDESRSRGKISFNKLNLELNCDLPKKDRAVLEGLVGLHNELVIKGHRYIMLANLARMNDEQFNEAVKSEPIDRETAVKEISDVKIS